MLELISIGKKAGYLAGPTNLGVLEAGEGRVVLIDSGLDAQTVKKALKTLAENGKTVMALINTHAHADHIGGNAYLAGLGIPIYAPLLEAPFIENPLLEPLCLLGGASPWKGMRNKFVLAAPSQVTSYLRPGSRYTFGRAEVEIVDLSGHSLGQAGILAGEVLFSADGFLGQEVLQKHVIPYNVDIPAYLASLARIRNMQAGYVLPGHGKLLAEPGPAIEENESTVLSLIEMVYGLIAREKLSLAAVMQELFSSLGLAVESDVLYFLYRTAVLAYLSFLMGEGRALVRLENNMPVFLAG